MVLSRDFRVPVLNPYPSRQGFDTQAIGSLRLVHFGIKLQFEVGILIQTLPSRLNYHMRALSIFLILIVVLMNTVKCPGCSQTFGQSIAIKVHQRTCAGLCLVGQKRINKRLQNAQKREVVKLARIEGQSMDDIVEERWELRAGLDDNVVHYPAEVPNPDLPAGPSTVS